MLQRSALFAASFLCFAALASAGTVPVYQVTVDTTSISGTAGSLDFNFNPGPLATQSASLQILSFATNGTLTGSPTLTGDVAGTLPTALTFDNGSGFNDYFQGFTYGSTLLFQVSFYGPALSLPDGVSTSGSTFAFSMYSNAAGTVPALTTDTSNGFAFTVNVNLDGTTTVTNSAGSSATVQVSQVAQDAQTITFGPLSNVALSATPITLTATASSGLAVGFTSTTPLVCTVSASTLTLIAPGACSITASQAGSAIYATAIPVVQSFVVSPAPQTITFGPPNGVSLGISPFMVGATASSGLAVSFASATSAVCTVSGNTVTIVAAGTCSIVASQAGNAGYAAATPVTRSFSVTAGQTITFGTLSSVNFGAAPFSVSATASSGLPVSFSSTTTAVCEVSGNTVTILATGTCSIAASQAGNMDYAAAAPVTQSFTVAATGSAFQTITFDAVPSQIFGASPFPIAAEASSLLPVAFAWTTPAVCKLAGDLVMLLSAGTCSITASQPGSASYSAANPVTRSFTVSVANPSGSFRAATGSPLMVGDDALATGDFNGDGIPDLAVANFQEDGSSILTVLLGTGSGGFSAAPGSPFALAVLPNQIVVGDFNGDGIQDLAATNLGVGVIVLLGNGSGGFTAAPGSPVMAGSFPVSLAVGDFNGDGIQDLAVANSDDNTVTVLLGNGSAGFTASTGSPFAVGRGPANVAIGDFNGDGIQDLAVTNFSGGTVLLGNGSGGFTAATGSRFSFNGVAVGDFNGDGIQDLATGSQDSDNVMVLLGDGSGGFTPTAGSPFAAGANPASVAVGDFNGDGVEDLAVANFGSNNVTVLLGNGSGGFTEATGSPLAVGVGPALVVVGDFNGDGIEDLATANSEDGTVSVLLGFLVGHTAQTITFGALNNVSSGVLSFAISATASSGLAVGFASASAGYTGANENSPPVCKVAGSTVTVLGVGTCSIAASQAGNATYAAAATVTQSFKVQGPQTITFAPLSTQIVGNPPFTLNASASSELTVAFASNSIGVCTVSATMVTLVAAGTCSITATQPGNSFYTAAEPVTVTFAVDPVFADTVSGDTAAENEAIDLMATYGITSGCSATPFDYCPNESVTRGEMAVFIVRSIFGGNNFTYNPVPYFTDVPANAQFFKYIQKMKDLGITTGETATTYGPNDTITRGEMAVFIIRARYGTGVAFNYTPVPYFTDVPAGAQFFQYIQKMRDVGITSGETATTYGPNDPVTRGQMAVFVMRGGYNLLLPATTPVGSAVSAATGKSPVTGTAGGYVNVTIIGANTNFVQGTTVVTAGAGVTVQSVTVYSATFLIAQLAIAGNATLGPRSIVATTGTQEAVAPNGFTITSDPAAGVIAYFTGNNTTVDAVSGLSGTLLNGATYAPATSRTQGLPDAQAFSLNGTNSYVQAAAGETATLSGARTLVAWVYPNPSTGLGMPILTGGSTAAAGDIFGITGTTGTCSAGGQYQLYIDHSGTCYVSDNSLLPNTWSLVAVTFDGANVVFSINGVASVPVPAQLYNYGLSTDEIGGDTLSGTSTAPSFNGLLSEVQIYNRALSPAEIQGMYAP